MKNVAFKIKLKKVHASPILIRLVESKKYRSITNINSMPAVTRHKCSYRSKSLRLKSEKKMNR